LIWTVNISQGGMQLDLHGDEPKPGSPLTVKLTPPAGLPIELEAQVRHVTEVSKPGAPEKRWQVGVQFVNLDEARNHGIELLLKAHGGPLPPVTLRKKDGK